MAIEPISAGITAAVTLATELMKQSAAQKAAAQAARDREFAINYQLGNQRYQLGNQRNALESGQDTETGLLGTANQTQAQSLAAQQRNLQDVLLAARGGQEDRLGAAGALRFDRFGNATYYDRDQGRWVTALTPQQRRLQGAEGAQQERTLARGAQADEDYAQQRAGYLYNRPPAEAVIQDQIRQLIQSAQGQGERGLNTIMQRFGIRTAGNIPSVQQMDTGPSPGQQLAETMLKARQAGLSESQSREQAHSARYLPAMAAFEKTALTRSPESTVGREVSAMQASGANDRLAALTDYSKMLPNIYDSAGKQRLDIVNRSGTDLANALTTGAKLKQAAFEMGSRGLAAGGVPGASSAGAAAAGGGATLGGIASLINALKPEKDKTTGMVGPTAGGTYSKDDDAASSGDGTPTIGNWDHRYTFAPESAKSGTGKEVAPYGGTMQMSAEDRAAYDPWGYAIPTNASSPQFMAGPSYISVPDYSVMSGSPTPVPNYYNTPWSF